ncbi:MAG: B12-binding domain-containing radical SAM protein [Nanobdellota archaeon]
MSKIALIQGIDKDGERYGPSLGLHSLASWVRSEGHEADVIDGNLGGFKDNISADEYVLRELDRKKYDMVGISSLHATIPHDLFLSHQIKRRHPEIPILFGGQEATFNRKPVAQGSRAEIGVMGEGEHVLSAIMHKADTVKQREGRLTGKRLMEAVQNIPSLYLMNGDGSYHWTGYGTQLDKDDFRRARMGIEYDRIPYEEYRDAIGKVIVSLVDVNACLGKCSFCVSTNFYEEFTGRTPKVHYLPSDDLVELIDRVVGELPPIDTIYFNGDNFLLGKPLQRRGAGLSLKFMDRDLDVSMLAATRVDNIPPDLSSLISQEELYSHRLPEELRKKKFEDVNLLDILHAGGFASIAYGVESFSDTGLKSLNKKVSVDTIVDTLDATLEAELEPWINVILGTPHIDIAGIRDNLQAFMIYWETGASIAAYPFVEVFEGSWYSRNSPYKDDMIKETYEVGDTGIMIERGSRLKIYDNAVEELMLAAMDRKPAIDADIKGYTGLKNLPSYLESGTLTVAILDAAQRLGIDLEAGYKKKDVYNEVFVPHIPGML